ncbi:MAG TPA: FAD-dependent monooxygenase, partial [Streptosporangiaceae bacterium]
MYRTAVVVGASVAGLAAARVLSDYYESVVVLERDELPNARTSRRGVPQGPHSHVLLAAGLREFERLLPGFRADLISAGGTAIDIGSELYLSRYNRAWPSVPSGVEFVSVSRPLLELILRERIVKLPPVAIREGVAVTALTGTPDSVTGVLLDTGERVAAELVVDCSGRGGRSDRWLTDLGLPVPERIDIKIGLGYATRLYRRGSGDLPGWKGIVTLPDPPQQHTTGVAFPIEDDRWLVGLVAWHIDELPADDASFTAAVRALPDPSIAQLLDRVQPLTDPVTARLRSNHRRLFERLDRVPAGYLTLGDAICSFNPFYGQGMTCAVQEAVALGSTLERHGRPTAAMVRDYYRAAAAVVATPWQMAIDGDFAYPETTGPRPRGVAIRNWYGTRLMLASQVVPALKPTFFGALQLVVPPNRLMRPWAITQALLHGGRPTAGRGPLTTFIRRQGTRRWMKILGRASAPADRYVGRISHGRITMLGTVGLPSL